MRWTEGDGLLLIESTYKAGRGTRTIIITTLDDRATPAVVDRVVFFKAERESHPSSQDDVGNSGKSEGAHGCVENETHS